MQKAKDDLAFMPGFTEEMAEQMQYVLDLILQESRKRKANREDLYDSVWVYVQEEEE